MPGIDSIQKSPYGQAEWKLFNYQTTINANYDVVAEAEAITRASATSLVTV